MLILFLSGEQFIHEATGVDTGIGHDLESCTSEIGIIKMSFPDYSIVFVDTPGFEDSKNSDSDILKMISDWLEIAYVVFGCTKDAANISIDVGLGERSCLAVFSISTGYQMFA